MQDWGTMERKIRDYNSSQVFCYPGPYNTDQTLPIPGPHSFFAGDQAATRAAHPLNSAPEGLIEVPLPPPDESPTASDAYITRRIQAIAAGALTPTASYTPSHGGFSQLAPGTGDNSSFHSDADDHPLDPALDDWITNNISPNPYSRICFYLVSPHS